MGVEIQRKPVVPTTEKILVATLAGPSGRSVTVRPESGDVQTDPKKGIRTVQLNSVYGMEAKWAATLGDLHSFGQALIDIADGK